MSGQLRHGFTGYLGIIDGVVYQIDSALHSSWKPLDLVPAQLRANALEAGLVNPVNESPVSVRPDPPLSAPARGRVPAPKDESVARLFIREGTEPLRAGHPDLWHLLIAGTCLEGSTFRSG